MCYRVLKFVLGASVKFPMFGVVLQCVLHITRGFTASLPIPLRLSKCWCMFGVLWPALRVLRNYIKVITAPWVNVLEMPILWLPELSSACFLWHFITADLRWRRRRQKAMAVLCRWIFIQYSSKRISEAVRWPCWMALTGIRAQWLGTERQQPCPRRSFRLKSSMFRYIVMHDFWLAAHISPFLSIPSRPLASIKPK